MYCIYSCRSCWGLGESLSHLEDVKIILRRICLIDRGKSYFCSFLCCQQVKSTDSKFEAKKVKGEDILYIFLYGVSLRLGFFLTVFLIRIICRKSLPTASPQNQLIVQAATAAAGDSRRSPLHARVTILTWQLTLCQRGCAERCIRSDNEEHTSTWEWGN